MNEELIPLEVIKNEKTSRFELNVDGHIAFIDYKQEDDVIKSVVWSFPKDILGENPVFIVSDVFGNDSTIKPRREA